MLESDEECNPTKESGYFSKFKDPVLTEMTLKTENILKEPCDDDNHFERSALIGDLDEKAHAFIDRPIVDNIFYPNLDILKITIKNCYIKFKFNLRNSLERRMDQENRMEVFGTVVTNPMTYADKMQPFDFFEITSTTEPRSLSPDIFCDSSDDEQSLNHQNAIEPGASIVEKSRGKQILIADIENLMIKLLQDLVSEGSARLSIVNGTKWENCKMFDGIMILKEPSSLIHRSVNMQHLNCRYHFAVIMYILSEIYHLLITDTTCTERELYYDDPELTETQFNVKSAIGDICFILNTSPWQLGIRSSAKGLIAGAIRIHMSNNLIIDCNMCGRATLIPSDIQAITFLETTAKFVLIIEKDTIFEKLLKDDILHNLKSDVVLITGKGYPDLITRMMVVKLWNDFRLPIYALVDADPFGIEIMFVYRFGSKTMVLNSDHLACPQIRWIGIQPSEIDMLVIPSLPQSKEDKKKVIELIQRPYVSKEIRNELEILQRLGRKAEIEGVAGFSTNFLVSDYIPNKIKRNLVI